jgi:NlpC/P60 family
LNRDWKGRNDRIVAKIGHIENIISPQARMKSIAISRRQIYLLWCLALFLLIVLTIQPISYSVMRMTIALLVAAIWLGIIYLWWRRVAVRIGAFASAVIIAVFLLLPGRPIDVEALRSAYINSLRTYTGTKYVWGGENRLGIDCSGLVRQGLIQANFQQGIATVNPGLARQGMAMWWFDLSALALRDGERGWTTRLFRAASINEIDRQQLLAGDLAATVDGQHILAYIGQNQWIEADPGYHKVMVEMVPDSDNFWFRVPVYVLRWHQLDRSAIGTARSEMFVAKSDFA